MSEAYHLRDWQTLTLSGSEEVTVAAVRGVTITPSVEIDELWSADQGTVEELKQREFTCDVEIEYARFDSDLAEEWMGGDGTTSTSFADNSDPQEFELTFEVDATDAADVLEITVSRIVFEEMPLFDGSHDDWTTWDLSGTGYELDNVETVSEA